MMGRGDKAFELFQMLNPINHTRTDKEVRLYAKEPYVMAADVYTASPHEGRGGWTWYTGAAGWMYQAGLESILGIRREGDQLVIEPCIPADWPEFTATYRHGQTKYKIHVVNSRSTNRTSERADNQSADLISEKTDMPVKIPLVDDGKVHNINLTL